MFLWYNGKDGSVNVNRVLCIRVFIHGKGGNISVNLVNKKVTHETFGKGNVINYDDSYIKINFKSGERRFVFPDVFKRYVTFVDGKATKLVDKKIEKKEEIQRKEDKLRKEMLKQKRLLQEKQEYLAKQKRQMRNRKVDPRIQSVFWCKSDEEDEIFTEWKVFTGEIKSGKSKGQPRKLIRMNQNSACLLTKRDNNMKEEDRQILGVFMASESFNGRTCEDGYITAHPEYRIRLSQEESEKMLFWNYYVDSKSSDKTVWNSGRQRYFDNILTAQILRDIVIVKENPEEKQLAQAFFDHYCNIHLINKDELPKANGVLMRI